MRYSPNRIRRLYLLDDSFNNVCFQVTVLTALTSAPVANMTEIHVDGLDKKLAGKFK